MKFDGWKYHLKPYVNRLLVWGLDADYFIKKGYIPNLLPDFYKDNFELSSAYQEDVYKRIVRLVNDNKSNSLIDVGCGYGIKLKKFIEPVCKDITGVDLKEQIEFCRLNYKFGSWIVDDISRPVFDFKRKFDIVVSVDVIEHLVNPDQLLLYIRKLARPDTWIVLSTPERDRVRRKAHMGPAGKANPAHVREWNKSELSRYLTSRGFEIAEHVLVNDVHGKKRSVPGRRFGKTCQVVVGRFT